MLYDFRCTICNQDVKYKSRGWKAMESHMTKAKHQDAYRVWKANYQIIPSAIPDAALSITTTSVVTYKDRHANAQVCS